MQLSLLTARGQVSLGGGFVRIWWPGQGLTVEMPACVAVREDGEVAAFGEEAAQLEGKLPPGMKIIRPFWSERIQDRTLVKFLLQEALKKDRESQRRGWQEWFLQYTLVVNESTPDLHHRWLRKAAEEVWPWPWKELPGLRALASQRKKDARFDHALIVIDCGFSAARGVVLVGNETLTLTEEKSLSLYTLCHELCALEEEHYGIRFAPSLFYTQQWGTRQAGLRASDHQPVLQPVHREVMVQHTQKAFDRFVQWLEQSISYLPLDVQSELQHEGIWLTGGAAPFFLQANEVEKRLNIPVHHLSSRLVLGGS